MKFKNFRFEISKYHKIYKHEATLYRADAKNYIDPIRTCSQEP